MGINWTSLCRGLGNRAWGRASTVCIFSNRCMFRKHLARVNHCVLCFICSLSSRELDASLSLWDGWGRQGAGRWSGLSQVKELLEKMTTGWGREKTMHLGASIYPSVPGLLKSHQLFLNDLKWQNFVNRLCWLTVNSENVQPHTHRTCHLTDEKISWSLKQDKYPGLLLSCSVFFLHKNKSKGLSMSGEFENTATHLHPSETGPGCKGGGWADPVDQARRDPSWSLNVREPGRTEHLWNSSLGHVTCLSKPSCAWHISTWLKLTLNMPKVEWE